MDFNTYNQHIYAIGTSAVPDLLATAGPIQEAIRLQLESIDHNPIRVLELGFGSRPHRWQYISNHSLRSWHITLSDFSLTALPDITTFETNVKFQISNVKLDLLHPIWPDTKYDAIVSTYTFDSIQFPQDHYTSGIHYPGGLIYTVKSAMSHIAPGGLFLTIDRHSTSPVPEHEPAGPAHFKTLNLQIAKQKLTAQGYTCSLESLEKFLTRHQQSLPLQLSDHSVLIVKSSSSAAVGSVQP